MIGFRRGRDACGTVSSADELQVNRLWKTLIFVGAGGLLGLVALIIFPWNRPEATPRIEVGWTGGTDRPCLLLICEDFPTFWSRFGKTPAGLSLQENAPFLIDIPLLMLRKTCRIRFTPLRWRLWLGKRAEFGWFPGDGMWFLAADGGILSRLAGKYLWGPSQSPASGVMNAPSTIVQISPNGEFYLVHGWNKTKEKHLKDIKNIKNNIKKSKIYFNIDLEGRVLGVWNNAPPWIRAEALSLLERSVKDVLSDDLAFSIQNKALLSIVPAEKMFNETAFPRWIISIFKSEFIGFYFFELKIEQGVPVPDLLLVSRNHQAFPAGLTWIPIRERVLGDHPIWQLDVLPPWLQIYGVSYKDRLYLATVASRLMGLLDRSESDLREIAAEREEACLEAHIQWSLLAKSARQLLQFMADRQALPGISDPRELELHWFPLLRWLETLGDADMACFPASGGVWQIRGHLWNPPVTDS